jgi:hypothetical protein
MVASCSCKGCSNTGSAAHGRISNNSSGDRGVCSWLMCMRAAGACSELEQMLGLAAELEQMLGLAANRAGSGDCEVPA